MAATGEEILQKVDKQLNLARKLDANPDLGPVLLVPGLAGSILTAVDENGHKERVWVRIFDAEREFRKKLWSLFDPTTGKAVSLDTTTRIEVPEDRFGLYACDILDPDILFPLNTLYYFHNMIQKLESWGYEEGTTLFGFGYDFRQSNRLRETMDLFKTKLECIHKASGGKKVKIISHSMGGILVKCFLSLHSEDFEKYVKTWVTIGTPFQGAPGLIMTALLTGVAFVKDWLQNLYISKWCMHQMFVECPSMYELMASPEFKWSSLPVLKIWRDKKDGFGHSSVELESYGPDDCVNIMRDALVNNTIDYDGRKIALPFNFEILKWANETRRIMSLGKIPPSVKFYNIYGTGKDTPFGVTYGSEQKPISSMEQLLHSEAVYSCVEGDEMVPIESAMADELEAKQRIGVPSEHQELVRHKRVFCLLRDWLKDEDEQLWYDSDEEDYVIVQPGKTILEENKRALSD